MAYLCVVSQATQADNALAQLFVHTWQFNSGRYLSRAASDPSAVSTVQSSMSTQQGDVCGCNFF